MRALWRDGISFGLVTIPVSLYPATKPEELKFRSEKAGKKTRAANRRKAA